MLKYIIYLAALSGCATTKQQYGEFEAYVNSFVAEAASRGVVINEVELPSTIKLATLKDYTLGICKVNGTIEINVKYWKSLSLACRDHLLMHELGHCVLNRHHENGGIMAETMVDYPHCGSYIENRTAYLDLLFGVTH